MVKERQELYSWPSEEDLSWEPVSSIVKLLSPPVFIAEKSTARKQLFRVQI